MYDPEWRAEYGIAEIRALLKETKSKQKKAKMFLSLLSLFTLYRTLKPVNKCLRQETVLIKEINI